MVHAPKESTKLESNNERSSECKADVPVQYVWHSGNLHTCACSEVLGSWVVRCAWVQCPGSSDCSDGPVIACANQSPPLTGGHCALLFRSTNACGRLTNTSETAPIALFPYLHKSHTPRVNHYSFDGRLFLYMFTVNVCVCVCVWLNLVHLFMNWMGFNFDFSLDFILLL